MKKILIMFIMLILTITGCTTTSKKEESLTITESNIFTETVNSDRSNEDVDIKLNAIASSPAGDVVGCGYNGVVNRLVPLKYNYDVKIINNINFEDIVYYNNSFVMLGTDMRNHQKVLYQYRLDDNKVIGIQTLDWNIRSLKVTNEKLFLIGSQELIATNLTDWEEIIIGEEEYQKDIYYGTIDFNGDLYVVTGGGGFIATSTDLKEWNFISEPQPGSLTSYGSTVMDKTTVVVGDHLWIATSIDGQEWFTPYTEEDLEEKKIKINNKEQIPDYEALCLFDVTNNGEEFVAVGQRGLVLASKDGVTWDVKQSNINSWIMDILWNGEYYVALCRDGIYSSSDAETWERLSNIIIQFGESKN